MEPVQIGGIVFLLKVLQQDCQFVQNLVYKGIAKNPPIACIKKPLEEWPSPRVYRMQRKYTSHVVSILFSTHSKWGRVRSSSPNHSLYIAVVEEKKSHSCVGSSLTRLSTTWASEPMEFPP